MLLSGCFSLAVLTGCKSLQDTSFAPLDARLEPIPGGGAQGFVVINTSGQVLHNYRFSAYMWDDRAITYTADNNSSLPKRLPAMTYTFMGSGFEWEPGRKQRFRDRDLGSEIKISCRCPGCRSLAVVMRGVSAKTGRSPGRASCS
jgi:hypothetical protein